MLEEGGITSEQIIQSHETEEVLAVNITLTCAKLTHEIAVANIYVMISYLPWPC